MKSDEISNDSEAIKRRQALLFRIKNRSFVERNKRKNYNEREDYRRWVGTSLDFNDKNRESLHVKLDSD